MKTHPPLRAALPRRNALAGAMVFQRAVLAFRLRRATAPSPPLREPFTERALALLRGEAPRH
ncbi:MAG TPA: hypothetical protein VGC74_10870 [Stenotrophomonas sp.]|jgi:hypothetical protein